MTGLPQPMSGQHSGVMSTCAAAPQAPLHRNVPATTLTTLLMDLARATEDVRVDALIGEIMEHTEPLTRTIAIGLCRHFHADRTTFADDFAQCVRLEAIAFLRQLAGNPQALAEVRSYQAVLSWRGRNAASEWWARNGPQCVVSGQVSRSRRLAELNRTRALMVAEGIADPTSQQVLTRHNARVSALRKDAARQGLLASESDFAPVASVPIHDATVAIEAEVSSRRHGWGGGHADEPLLEAVDRRRFVDLCISACAMQDQQYRERTGRAPTLPLAQVARRWFAEMACDDSSVASFYDGPPDARMLAAEFGVSTSLIYQTVRRVRLTSGAIATEVFLHATGDVPAPRTA